MVICASSPIRLPIKIAISQIWKSVAMMRILLIEDDHLVRSTVRLTLQRAGYEVVSADDSRQVLAALSRGDFCLVVTDILMPGMDGLEIILRIRGENPGLPIIAMSGGGQQRNMDILGHAQAFGATVSLRKPFPPDELLAAVSQALTGFPQRA